MTPESLTDYAQQTFSTLRGKSDNPEQALYAHIVTTDHIERITDRDESPINPHQKCPLLTTSPQANSIT